MRCEACQGRGLITVCWPIPNIARRRNALVYEDWPCASCNGSGIASCCEGACGGPDEATNLSPIPDRVLP